MTCVDNGTRTCLICHEQIKRGNATNSIDSHFEENHPEKLVKIGQISTVPNMNKPMDRPIYQPFRQEKKSTEGKGEIHCKFCGEEFATMKHTDSSKRQRLIDHRKKCHLFLACVVNISNTCRLCRICNRQINRGGGKHSIYSHFEEKHPEKLYKDGQKPSVSNETNMNQASTVIELTLEASQETVPLGHIKITEVSDEVTKSDEVASEISRPMREKIDKCPVCHFCGTLMAKQKRDVKVYKSFHRQGCEKFKNSFDLKQRKCFLCEAKIKIGHSIDMHFVEKHPQFLKHCEHTELIEETKPVEPTPKRMKNCLDFPMIFVDGKPEVIETFAKSSESSEEVCLGYNEQVDIIDGDVNVDSL